MRIEIDWTRCDGHGLCALLAPDVLESDPARFPVVRARSIDPRHLHSVRQAAATCPALALHLRPEVMPPTPASPEVWPGRLAGLLTSTYACGY